MGRPRSKQPPASSRRTSTFGGGQRSDKENAAGRGRNSAGIKQHDPLDDEPAPVVGVRGLMSAIHRKLEEQMDEYRNDPVKW